MQIREEDEWKTVFKTRYGYFKYQIIFFRLINTLAIFQNYINKILIEKFVVFMIIYFDDIFIYTKNKEKEYINVI